MNHWVKRGLQGVLLTGGLWAIGAGIASAKGSNDASSTPASGSGIHISINLPVNVEGNSIAILGHATPAIHPVSPAGVPAAPVIHVGSGSGIGVSVNAPVNVSGNSVAILGSSSATSTSGGTGGGTSSATSSGNDIHAPSLSIERRSSSRSSKL